MATVILPLVPPMDEAVYSRSAAASAGFAAASEQAAAASASEAAASAVTAAGAITSAAAAAASAAGSAAAAGNSATAAGINYEIYADTAAGLAATTNGQYFSVPSASVGGYLDLYLNSTGTAVLQKTYPSAAGVLAARVHGEIVSGSINLALKTGEVANKFSVYVGANTVIRPLNPGVQKTAWGAFENGTTNPWLSDIPVPAGEQYVIDATTLTGPAILYCDRNGVFACGTTVPSSDHIVVAYQTTWATGTALPMKPILPTLGWKQAEPSGALKRADKRRLVFDAVNELGWVGDGLTANDITASINAFVLAKTGQTWNTDGYTQASDIEVHVAPGTYVVSAMDAKGVKFVGSDRDAVILKSSSADSVLAVYLSHAEHITFTNLKVDTSHAADKFIARNCKFQIDPAYAGPDLSGMYFVKAAVRSGSNGFIEVEDCEFSYPAAYIGLWANAASAQSVKIRNNKLTGTAAGAAHGIRVDGGLLNQKVEVVGNVIQGGITGIFFPSNRAAPIEGALIERNVVSGVTEEGISLDGIANSESYVPTICSGTITSASNDVNGRLVIVASMVYRGGGVAISAPVSWRSDWTNFYFTFEDGSGIPGTIAKIYAYDAGAGTLTLDMRTPAASVTATGRCGVQSGHFGAIIRGNIVRGSFGSGMTYATGISLWQGICNSLVEDNTIYGGAQGIDVAGGVMLTDLRVPAWGNTVRGNRIVRTTDYGEAIGTDHGSIRCWSAYGTMPQYGNVFVDNEVRGGGCYVDQQKDFTWDGNRLIDSELVMKSCATTLPTADASQLGRRFMVVTEDGSGVPTAITYYVCKLAGGVYSWVEV